MRETGQLPPPHVFPPPVRPPVFGPPSPEPPLPPILSNYPEPSIEGGFYVYRRVLQLNYRSGPVYRSVPIHSRTLLTMEQLEGIFRERAEEIAEYANFRGVFFFVNPWDVDRPTPPGYVYVRPHVFEVDETGFGLGFSFDFDYSEFPDFEPMDCGGV